MPTVDQVRDVLATINDPELRRSIVELGMVKGIDVQPPSVTVDLALTIPGCPLKSFFQEVLPAKIKATFPEIETVQINLGAMTEEERKALVGGVKSQEPASFAHPQSRTTVFAVGSGKGGVGKSSVTVNLAASLASRGFSVGLMDADVWGFSSSRMLGNSSQPTVIDHLIIPVEVYGFKMISMGNMVDDERPIVWRGPMLHKFIQAFLTDVHWEDPEYLLIDMPPGTGDVSISLAQFLPGANMILVTTPQQAAEKVAERAGHMALKVGMNVGGVVENMSYLECAACGDRTYPFGEGGGRQLAETFEAPLLGQIPLDPRMRELADHGKPSVIATPDSASAREFERAVDNLVARFPAKKKSRARTSLPLIMQPPKAPVTTH